MPFYSKIPAKSGSLYTWHLTEAWEELLSPADLSASDLERFRTLGSDKRKTEFLAIRLLLKRALRRTASISYSESGRPYLSEKNHCISVSHSADFAVLAVSEEPVGIDIEQTNRNIERIAKRFLHAEEYLHVNELPKRQMAMIAYWAAKEAVFKCTPEKAIQFNEQIRIDAFEPSNEKVFAAHLHVAGKLVDYTLKMHLIDNNILVHCVEELKARQKP